MSGLEGVSAGQRGVAADVVVRNTKPTPAAESELQAVPRTDESCSEAFFDYISSHLDGYHVSNLVRRKYGQDAFFKTIIKNSKHHKNFVESNGLLILKDGGQK